MNIEPDGPYIYQPFGMQDEKHWKAGKIYAIGGLSHLTTIRGLVKEEADKILEVILANPSLFEGKED